MQFYNTHIYNTQTYKHIKNKSMRSTKNSKKKCKIKCNITIFPCHTKHIIILSTMYKAKKHPIPTNNRQCNSV